MAKPEAAARLARLVKTGNIVQVAMQDDADNEYFVRTEDFSLLESPRPEAWVPAVHAVCRSAGSGSDEALVEKYLKPAKQLRV